MGEITIKNNILVNDYHIIKAEPTHFDQLIELFLDIALWLRSKGLSQWGHFLDGYGRDDVIRSINSGNCLLVTRENAIIGTVTVQCEPDEWDQHIWQDTNLDDSIFIHRLAMSRSHSNRGIGSELLGWIEGNHDITANKKYIKLDCVSDNKLLNEYYLSKGYEYVGCTDDGHSKYQKTMMREL